VPGSAVLMTGTSFPACVSRGPALYVLGGPALGALEGVGGGLEVDAEGIATPAAHWQPYSIIVLLYSSNKAPS
jgi:hypothetical protein